MEPQKDKELGYPTYDFAIEGAARVQELRENYTHMIVSIRRAGRDEVGRHRTPHLGGGILMPIDEILQIEEYVRRWGGGGGYLVTLEDPESHAPVMRLKFDLAGAMIPWCGPGSNGWAPDPALDGGFRHLPTERRLAAAAAAAEKKTSEAAAAAPPIGGTDTVSLLAREDRRFEKTIDATTRELDKERKRNEELERQNKLLLETSLREKSEAHTRVLQAQLESLREEIKRQREAPPPARSAVDWIGIATALAAPLAGVMTAVIQNGTERQRLVYQQPVPQQPPPQRSLLAEIKELLSIPGADRLLSKVLGGQSTNDDRVQLLELVAEQNLASVTLWRDLMSQMTPPNDPMAVQVTRMIGEGLERIASVVASSRAQAGQSMATLQQQPAQQPTPSPQADAQPTQQGQQQPVQEHVAEVMQSQDPEVRALQEAFDRFPQSMQTQEWATLLENAFGLDRATVRSEEVDMLASVAVELFEQSVRAGIVPAEIRDLGNEQTVKALAALLLPFSEAHAIALFHALRRTVATRPRTPAGAASTGAPRPREQIGGDGRVVPFERPAPRGG